MSALDESFCGRFLGARALDRITDELDEAMRFIRDNVPSCPDRSKMVGKLETLLEDLAETRLERKEIDLKIDAGNRTIAVSCTFDEWPQVKQAVEVTQRLTGTSTVPQQYFVAESVGIDLKKIKAIKAVRDLTGKGLKESKDVVEGSATVALEGRNVGLLEGRLIRFGYLLRIADWESD